MSQEIPHYSGLVLWNSMPIDENVKQLYAPVEIFDADLDGGQEFVDFMYHAAEQEVRRLTRELGFDPDSGRFRRSELRQPVNHECRVMARG